MYRSQLSYCSTGTIWRPHLLKDIILIENVQCRATNWILNIYTSDYKCRLIELHILPLMMVFEICNLYFFLKSLRSPSEAFNILICVSFSSNPTQSFGINLRHQLSRSNFSHHFYFSHLPMQIVELVTLLISPQNLPFPCFPSI